MSAGTSVRNSAQSPLARDGRDRAISMTGRIGLKRLRVSPTAAVSLPRRHDRLFHHPFPCCAHGDSRPAPRETRADRVATIEPIAADPRGVGLPLRQGSRSRSADRRGRDVKMRQPAEQQSAPRAGQFVLLAEIDDFESPAGRDAARRLRQRPPPIRDHRKAHS